MPGRQVTLQSRRGNLTVQYLHSGIFDDSYATISQHFKDPDELLYKTLINLKGSVIICAVLILSYE